MKTTKNRIISLICAFVMVIATVAVAASCKKTNDSPDGSDSASGSVTENDVLANIPDSDFDGYKFKVLAVRERRTQAKFTMTVRQRSCKRSGIQTKPNSSGLNMISKSKFIQ